MKVLITTIVALNPGDAAILLGTMRLLQRAFGPDIEIVVVDRQATAAQRLYPWARFVPALFGARQRGSILRWIARRGYEHRLRELDFRRLRVAAWLMDRRLGRLAGLLSSSAERSVIDHYLSADLVLASGGTYLVPAYNMETPLRDYEFTLALGKPLGLMPQSMGPFKDSPLAPRFSAVFGRSRLVIVRDSQSASHLLGLGLPPQRFMVAPDAAFALAKEPDEPAAVGPSAQRLRVAVSVREWRHFKEGTGHDAFDRYVHGVAALVSWLVRERDADVTFMSSCQGIPEYWTDDAATARRVVEKLEQDVAARVEIDGKFRGPQELQEALGRFHAIVATRMHVAILAICAGVRVLPIAYEFKTTELFRELGLVELVTQIEEADGAALINRMSLLLDETSDIWQRFAAGRVSMGKKMLAIEKVLGCAI